MKKTSAIRLAGTCALALVSGTVATSAMADIRIAVVGPETGQFRALGEQMRLGAALAVADINGAGGINGERLILETGNDLCEADRATAVANQMVGRNVVAVIGHICSAASIAASQVYNNAAVIQISPASASPAFTDNRPDPAGGTYRLYGREDDQPKIAGQFLARRHGDQKIAFVHDGSGYGKGLADATRTAFEAAGGFPAFVKGYEAGRNDYSALVRTLKSQKIEVLFLGGYPAEAGIIARQMREQGMKTLLMGGDALLSVEYQQAAGDAATGTLVTSPPDPRNNPGSVQLVERIRGGGDEPEVFTLNAYAAVQVWAQAVRQNSSSAYRSVSQALNEGRFKTVVGDIAFNSRGDVSIPGYIVYEWQGNWYAPLPDQN